MLIETTASLQRLRVHLMAHHEQVELAILDLDRLASRVKHVERVLQAPAPEASAPAPALVPTTFTAQRRQREG